ncbi:MAG: hypothetical protein IT379_42215 [Deltaproteobacteria bacterium]|nr:hypothetical protein [Deltaproteobacteria bacterium]
MAVRTPVVVACLFLGQAHLDIARAQDTPALCPDGEAPADPSAPSALEAAEQALCWYERERRQEPACGEREGSVCMGHVDAWCDRAALDADPQVPNACFLARVRAGRHDDAERVLALIDRAWPEVESCRPAYRDGLVLGVEATRDRVTVLVGSAEAGSTPLETHIRHPWWRQRVEILPQARDGIPGQRERVDLLRQFDPIRCSLRRLVVTPLVRDPPARREPRARPTRPRTRSRSQSPGWLVLGAAGLAVGAGGGTLLIASEVEAAELRAPVVGTPWTASQDARLDRIDAFRLAGGLLIAVAAAAVTGGAIGWWLDLEESSEGP